MVTCGRLLQVPTSTLTIVAAVGVGVSACMHLCVELKTVKRGPPNLGTTLTARAGGARSFTIQNLLCKGLNIFCILGKSSPRRIFTLLNPDHV